MEIPILGIFLRKQRQPTRKVNTMYIAATLNNCDALKMALSVGAGSIQNSTLRETIERAAEWGFYDCVQILIPLCESKAIGRALVGRMFSFFRFRPWN